MTIDLHRSKAHLKEGHPYKVEFDSDTLRLHTTVHIAQDASSLRFQVGGEWLTARFSHYPFDEHLYSADVGLRLKTIVGPVRLEYGHNLNPRPQDPAGTIHFSLGFPF